MKGLTTKIRKRSTRHSRFSFFLVTLIVLCVSLPAQEFKTVARGVEYAEVTREFSGEPVRMNLLRLDLTKVRLDVVHANDAATGLEKTSSMAKRHGAFAAINGGFFRMDDSVWAGDPAGVLMINGKLLSESYKERAAIGIINDERSTKVYFGHPALFRAKARPRIDIAPEDNVRKHERAEHQFMFDPKIVPVLEDVTNGVPQLIRTGKVDITWEQEKTNLKFVETRHPRTAAAKLKDGKFLMITVDGRSESSGGISLYDLADYLLTLGATDAMNLDGGGSSTMYLDGKVVNHPSDKEGERRVSDAILVTLRAKVRSRRRHK